MFSINTTSDILKMLYVISQAMRRVKFETILKYHKWYSYQISHTIHAIICLYYNHKRFVIFTCRYFKLSWNTTALSQSNCRNFSCSSIKPVIFCNIIQSMYTVLYCILASIQNGPHKWCLVLHWKVLFGPLL